jgi:hypothetical protein
MHITFALRKVILCSNMTILFFLCQYTEDEQLGTSRSSPTRKTFFSNIERKLLGNKKSGHFCIYQR